ncbi:MAG: hypothetical protein O7F09_03605 [Chloroflexi bacterium]|nr:hypothetical protein [Chloroflexota bacterium]
MITKTALLLVLAVSALGVLACSPKLVQTDPKLPPGFLDTPVLTGDLNAYLYLSQGSPISFPLEPFGDIETIQGNPLLPEPLLGEADIHSLAFWMGPDLDSFGGDVVFSEETAAEIAELLLAAKSDNVTSWRRGASVSLVRGTGIGPPYTHLPFGEAYPTAWDLLRLLPESPPAEPVAAGFLDSTSTVIDPLASRAGLNLGRLAPALGSVNIGDVAFVAYSNRPITVPEKVTPGYLLEQQIGALLVTRSSYPGFLLSFFLNNFSGRVNLDKIEVMGESVLYREFADVHLMVKPIGNTIFFSLAPTRDFTESLIASVLETQLP